MKLGSLYSGKPGAFFVANKEFCGQKSGLVVSVLDSWFEGHGFESHPIIDGNGVKPCQNQFLHPILVHSIIEKERKYR